MPLSDKQLLTRPLKLPQLSQNGPSTFLSFLTLSLPYIPVIWFCSIRHHHLLYLSLLTSSRAYFFFLPLSRTSISRLEECSEREARSLQQIHKALGDAMESTADIAVVKQGQVCFPFGRSFYHDQSVQMATSHSNFCSC